MDNLIPTKKKNGSYKIKKISDVEDIHFSSTIKYHMIFK